MENLKSSRKENLEILFSYYKPRFIRFAEKYLGDNLLAEDFVMDAIIAYWEKKNILSEDLNVPAYILTIVKNKCLNYLRHQKTHIEVTSEMEAAIEWRLSMSIATLEACNPTELYADDIHSIYKQTLNQLPDKTRTVFVKSRMHRKSNSEIAEELSLSIKGVEFHITKALKKLRIALKDYTPFF
ncbi:MAG: RNA polymerase sigma-70 factor [Bacteroidales bacterium]